MSWFAAWLLALSADLARNGDSELATPNWVSAVLAQALAGIGDHAACERALERAERVRVYTRPGNGGWLRFDGSRLAEDRASCYVQQRRPDLAEPILLELLKKHQSGRRRGILLRRFLHRLLILYHRRKLTESGRGCAGSRIPGGPRRSAA